jgi:hypothetical protein
MLPTLRFNKGETTCLEAQRRSDYDYFIFLVDDVSVIEVDFGTGLLTENPFRTLEQ